MPFDFDDEDTIPAEQLEGPVLAVRTKIRLADFGSHDGLHRFGGPLALTVRGGSSKSLKLHRVLTLRLSDPLVGFSVPGVTEFPLVYGFVHDGCRLSYRVIADGQIEVLKGPTGSADADWPYRRYPAAFPEKRFALREDGVIEAEQVNELTWQGVEGIDPAEGVVVIVPPSETYGISLWGDGDDELVQVVFEIDPKTGTVAAYNQCT